MCGAIRSQKLLSGQLSDRNFLVRPPEPPASILVSDPTRSVYIGRTMLLRTPFFWNSQKLLNPHICAVGMTGAGKSFFVKTFIMRARLALGTPFLILDWSGEYADWVKSAGGKVIALGTEGINILELAGEAPQARIMQILDAFSVLLGVPRQSPQLAVIEDALEQAYNIEKRHLRSKKHAGKAPNLQALLEILERNKSKSKDAREAFKLVKGIVSSSGRAFIQSTIPLNSLTSGLVCIDLHALPTDPLRSLAGLSILQFLKEKMRSFGYSQKTDAPRLFIVVDEAWKIAKEESSEVATIVREGRKYGFGLIVASQNPTDVSKSIFSNAGTMLVFRLTHAHEREYVRSSLAYSDFYEEASHSLSVGQAIVHLALYHHSPSPRFFILKRVEGEDLPVMLHIVGGKMDLKFDKGELSSRLLGLGLSDSQVKEIMLEFEKHNLSIDACHFCRLFERFGYGRAYAVNLLRELGATEKQILYALSCGGSHGGASLALAEKAAARKGKAGKKSR